MRQIEQEKSIIECQITHLKDQIADLKSNVAQKEQEIRSQHIAMAELRHGNETLQGKLEV